MNNPFAYQLDCITAEYRRKAWEVVWFQDGSGMYRFFARKKTDAEDSKEICQAASLGELIQKAQQHINKQGIN